MSRKHHEDIVMAKNNIISNIFDKTSSGKSKHDI